MTGSLFFVLLTAASLMQSQAPATSRTLTGAQRLDIVANLGTVEIRAWARPEIQVEARHSDQIKVEIKGGDTVEVREHRPPRAALERVAYVIRVPVSTAIMLRSDSVTIDIQGVKGAIDVHAQHGDVHVADAGAVTINSTTGNLQVESADDAILKSTAGTVTARLLRGNVTADSVGGTITLSDVRGATVRVTSTSGDIDLAGAPPVGSVYDLASQSGAITVKLSGPVGFRLMFGTVRGRVTTSFARDGAATGVDGRTTLTVGDGRARVDIITFSGDITIERR
jgi:DUF4097 and DUF4098 domain-containing protein YvlB